MYVVLYIVYCCVLLQNGDLLFRIPCIRVLRACCSRMTEITIYITGLLNATLLAETDWQLMIYNVEHMLPWLTWLTRNDDKNFYMLVGRIFVFVL